MIRIKIEIDGKEYPLDNVNYSFVPSTPETLLPALALAWELKATK